MPVKHERVHQPVLADHSSQQWLDIDVNTLFEGITYDCKTTLAVALANGFTQDSVFRDRHELDQFLRGFFHQGLDFEVLVKTHSVMIKLYRNGDNIFPTVVMVEK